MEYTVAVFPPHGEKPYHTTVRAGDPWNAAHKILGETHQILWVSMREEDHPRGITLFSARPKSSDGQPSHVQVYPWHLFDAVAIDAASETYHD